MKQSKYATIYYVKKRNGALLDNEGRALSQFSELGAEKAPVTKTSEGSDKSGDEIAAAAVGEAARIARFQLEEMKAEEIIEIDLVGRTSIADTMFIASGRSDRHVGAIAEKVIAALKQAGFGPVRVEGMPACDWVLIDVGDILVHIFRPEVRGFYNLEKIWSPDRPKEQLAG